MGAIDASLIVTSIREGRYKQQFGRPLPSDCHGHLRPYPRSIAAECTDRFGDRAACRDEHVHQKAPAIRGRRNFFDEQTGDAIAGIAICECEVQGSLNLPAELPGLPLCLPVRGPAVGLAFAQSFSEVRIDEL
jgi:hypothetical protein